MKRIKQSAALAIILAMVGLTSMAQVQDVRRGERDYRLIGQILIRLDQRATRFKTTAQRAVDQSRMDNTRKEDKINQFTYDFQQSVSQLRDRFNRRQANDDDVQMVLDRAARVDNFLQRHPGMPGTDREWQMMRQDVDSLANAYNIPWNWEYRPDGPGGPGPGGPGPGYPGGPRSDARLTGTFRLNTAQSDDARLIVERAVHDLPYNDRQRVSEMLLRRVDAPEMLAIEQHGQSITLASSRAPQMTFDADGREQTEQMPNSQRMSRVVASLTGDQLNISMSGDRATDFSVTFDPINGGRQLRVTRRLSSDRLTQPVVVQSTYDEDSPNARWDVYNGGPSYGNDRPGDDRYRNPGSGDDRYRNPPSPADDFIVPDGMMIVGRLNDNLDTHQAHAGDRFTLRVISPREFEGATIQGHIGDVNRSGRVAGRAELALNFDSILLRNGRTARFEGTLDSVRTTNGDTVRVDTEGTVKDSSQTTRTVTRTAVGSAIGAVIGAIAGGGKGAAVGAVVGGGAGAGSVFVQGRDDLQLTPGTEVSIRASSTIRRSDR